LEATELSSNSKGAPEKIRLQIKADSGETEIFVIDGKFKMVDRGVGKLDTELPPGLYDVKFKAGSTIQEVETVLEPGSEGLNITGPRMQFSSPAPINETSTSHEYHQQSAYDLSSNIHLSIGQGSSLFIFSRDMDVQGQTNTMTGLALHDLSGKFLADLSSVSVPGITGDDLNPSAGCTIELDPGSYRLRINYSETESLEQLIVTRENWQTQIFLNVREYISGTHGRYPDLTDSSIFMTRPGTGFEPGVYENRRIEMVRQGLMNNRDVVSKGEIYQMLREKFDNPMIGIYGIYLLILRSKPEISVLSQVHDNLRGLVGDHPDVRALEIFLDNTTGQNNDYPPFEGPTMLANSWDIVVKASATHPDLVPLDSLGARISGRFWGYSPWLIWMPPQDTEALDTTNKFDLSSLYDTTLKLSHSISTYMDIQKIAKEAGFTAIEQDLFEYLSGLALQEQQSPTKDQLLKTTKIQLVRKQLTPDDERLLPVNIIQSLRAPSSAVSSALNGLINKLNLS